jgi:hypothetical protein
MTINTAEATAAPVTATLAAEAALADEAKRIGMLARRKLAAAEALETAEALAADGENRWTPERLARAASWAASMAFQIRRFNGQPADWAECRDAVILAALGHGAAEAAAEAASCPLGDAWRAALATRDRKAAAERNRACKALAAAMKLEDEADSLAAAAMAENPEWPALAAAEALARRAAALRGQAHRLYLLALTAEARPLEMRRPECRGRQMPTIGTCNAAWLKGEALTWTKRRQADPEATAPEDLKGKRAASLGRRPVTAEDLGEALTAVRGKPASKLEAAFLAWAMAPERIVQGQRVPGMSKAEACTLVGLAPSNAKDLTKRAAKGLRAVDLKAWAAAAEADTAAEAAEWTPAMRAALWFQAAAARQCQGKRIDRTRGLIPAAPEARYLGEGQWAEATRLPAPARASLRESGPIRRRPLIRAAVVWAAARRKAERIARCRAFLATADRPRVAATIAAPRVYAMPTTVAAEALNLEAAEYLPQRRPEAPPAEWMTIAPLARSVAPSGGLKAHPRGVGLPTERDLESWGATDVRSGEALPTVAACMEARPDAARLACLAAEAEMAAALAAAPRGALLACPVTARPRPADALRHAGAWGEPMTRPEGLTARL